MGKVPVMTRFTVHPTSALVRPLGKEFNFSLMAVARDLSAVALHPADRKAGHPSETRAGAIGRFPDAGASPVQTEGVHGLMHVHSCVNAYSHHCQLQYHCKCRLRAI